MYDYDDEFSHDAMSANDDWHLDNDFTDFGLIGGDSDLGGEF